MTAPTDAEKAVEVLRSQGRDGVYFPTSPPPYADLVALLSAAVNARRFLDYFANNRTEFAGGGTPKQAIEILDTAIANVCKGVLKDG